MTNPYYAHTSGVPATLTRAASSQIRNEYDLIEDGFDLIDAAIDAKANIDSPTFTGTVTVPTPLTAAAAATKAYVDALSVAAGNVPAGGSTGQYLVKDSATDFDMSWGSIVSVGTGGTTSTASITLTASSAAAMSVTPATPGLYVTLPDATTCTKADNLYSVYNAGDFDYGVKDSAGTQLGWIRARTGAMIGLADNATAAGVWAYYGLEKVGVTATWSNTSLNNMGSNIKQVALDVNRTCFVFGGADLYAVVYDASTQTWGSATLIRSSIVGGQYLCVLSATNQVLVCSNNSTTAMQTVTLTISANTVTVNTPVSTTLAGNWASYGQLIAVGSSFVISYGRATNVSAIRAITVTGTVPTVGAESALTAAANTSAVLFASGSIVRTVSSVASNIYCKPYTVSGTTLTAGTEPYVPATAGASFRAFLNGNGNIVCHYINSTHYAAIFKLTGTAEAESTVSLGQVPGTLLSGTDYVQVSASKTVFMSHASATTWRANILTDTAGTASAGTELAKTRNNNIIAFAGFSANGNNAKFGLYVSGGGAFELAQMTLDCSGSSPVLSSFLHNTGLTTNPLTATFQSSDAYGVRSPTLLISGSSARVVSTASMAFDCDLSDAYVRRVLPSGLHQDPNSASTVGATSSESYFGVPGGGANTQGFVITKMGFTA